LEHPNTSFCARSLYIHPITRTLDRAALKKQEESVILQIQIDQLIQSLNETEDDEISLLKYKAKDSSASKENYSDMMEGSAGSIRRREPCLAPDPIQMLYGGRRRYFGKKKKKIFKL